MAVPRITKDELKARLDDPARAPLIVDARLKYPYEHSSVKLPGAIRMHPQQADTAALPRERDIVAYDSDPDELACERLALVLIRRGYRVSVLQGGIGEWLAAKLPVEAKEAPPQAAPAPGALKA